jgi:hypothetical protein
VGLADAVRALAEAWPDLAGRIDPATRSRLLGLAAELASPDDPAAQQEAALEILELVWPLLPADHPVRAAMAVGGTTRFTTTARDWALVTDPLVRQLTSPSRPPLEERLGPAERRLLEAPAYTGAEVRRRGEDPDQPQLIRLVREDGGVQLPAFQFDPSGRVIPVVLAVNRLLDADEDPWGVADWWLGGNAWLGAVPAQLLGRGHDDLLAAAARAVLVEY